MPNARIHENFLRMEAHSSCLIDSCVLPNGINYWSILRVLYNQCFSWPPYRFFKKIMLGQEFVSQRKFSLSPSVRASLQGIPRGGCAYFSRAVCSVFAIQARSFDPYLDPIAFVAQRQGVTPVKFQLATNSSLKYYLEPLVIPYDTEELIVLTSQVGVYPGYETYIDSSLQCNVPIIPFAALVQRVFQVMAYSDLFVDILAAMQPSMVILEEYYNDIAQGIVLACNRLGIPCAEYQHGLQVWPHIPYNFGYMPATGYAVVPEWFFVWGESGEQHYKELFAHQTYHKVAVAGKPDYLAWKIGRILDDPELIALLKKKIAGKKVICVPLQGNDYLIPGLEDVIRQSPADWIWLLRDHPLQAPIAHYWADKFPDRVEYTAATMLSLHTVLSLSQHMFFGGSSSALEAVFLHDMQATTFDEIGKKSYAQYITQGDIFYAEDTESGLANIHAAIDAYPYKPSGIKPVTQDIDRLGSIIKLLHLQWKAKQNSLK